MARNKKVRLCRICKKRPVWVGGDVNNPGPVCKQCYHKHVWPERKGAAQEQDDEAGLITDDMPENRSTIDAQMAALAKAIAVTCVRNTFLEDLHAGITPSSQAGDYSDVKVVSPYGEIPWHRLSRISDDEMKVLMKEVVNKLYTVLVHLGDAEFLTALLRWGALQVPHWDDPEVVPELVLPE
jgi:hypothetical protein